MNAWFCMDCLRYVELNKHGRCPWCDGNGVAPPTVRRSEEEAIAAYEVVILERLARRSEG